jgi:hypothetical protein
VFRIGKIYGSEDPDPDFTDLDPDPTCRAIVSKNNFLKHHITDKKKVLIKANKRL